MKIALSIAGSDSSGGAGIQADLKTFQAHGVFGTTAITAVTVQNTCTVSAIQEITPDIVEGQILCLFDDLTIDAVKIGMVASIPLIECIAGALGQVNPRPPIVLDPVMISKSGYALLEPNARQALVEYLFPLAEVVTPNLHEAEALVQRKVSSKDDMKTAAQEILSLGARKVVIKGGHLEGAAVDIIFDGETFEELSSQRFDTPNTHGTGCTFSSAIAANLALGKDFRTAVRDAKKYITGAIEQALDIGKGHGPTHHFYDLYARAGLKQ